MPTYVYECRSCKRIIEVEQHISEDALEDCSKCGATNTLSRVMQPVAIRFVGSGFHSNDYAPKPQVKPKAKSDSKGESKKDSKPEACTGEPSSYPACSKDDGLSSIRVDWPIYSNVTGA